MRRPICLLLIFFLILTLARPAAIATADEVTKVRLEPASVSLGPGATVKVQVRVEHVSNLSGVDLALRFDPTVLEVVDAEPAKDKVQVVVGPFLHPDMVPKNEANNTVGSVDFAVQQLNQIPAVSGTGVVMEMTLRARASGSSALTFTRANLHDNQGAAIPNTRYDGEVVVAIPGGATATVTPASAATATATATTGVVATATTTATASATATATTVPTGTPTGTATAQPTAAATPAPSATASSPAPATPAPTSPATSGALASPTPPPPAAATPIAPAGAPPAPTKTSTLTPPAIRGPALPAGSPTATVPLPPATATRSAATPAVTPGSALTGAAAIPTSAPGAAAAPTAPAAVTTTVTAGGAPSPVATPDGEEGGQSASVDSGLLLLGLVVVSQSALALAGLVLYVRRQ